MYNERILAKGVRNVNNCISNYRYFKYSALPSIEQSFYYRRVFIFIHRLSKEYSHFKEWYRKLFTADKKLNLDREIIVCEKYSEIVGIAILKNVAEEQKICTLRVAKEHQFQGIGKKLMELSFEWLENEKPLITLHKSKIWQFRSLFDYYGFELEQKKANYYNIFSTELVYNGILPDKKFIIGKFKPINLDDFCWEFIRSGRSDLADFFVVWLEQLYKKEIFRGI